MSEALRAARTGLADTEAWLVGGVLRDRVLGRESADLDVVIDGDPREAARAVAKAARGAACFALSENHGAWRVLDRDQKWQVDIERLRAQNLHGDLELRDFTINAIAQPLQGGDPIDPLGGLDDLAAGRLRMVSERTFAEDPLRILRLVRIAIERDLKADPDTTRSARKLAGELRLVSGERVFMELRRVVSSTDPIRGLALMDDLNTTPVVLPELDAMRGIEQNRFHHLDVHGHTLEVLQRVCELQRDPAAILGHAHSQAIAELLGEPLADELTRGDALRWGALLHDAAKPLTRGLSPEGRVTFIAHDTRGAQLTRQVLSRLRVSARLRSHVAALTEHHLRLGFLVHEPRPLAGETVFDYLKACQTVALDVTLLSVADRLATRGDGAEQAIQAHIGLAVQMLGDALRWRSEGPPEPLLRGDELAAELHIELGPRIGELLLGIARAQYAGSVNSRSQALAHARAQTRSG
jgi:putative nucleotidyltransferase with HDIG domain